MDWHTQQFTEPKRATLALRDLAASLLPEPVERALDAGCGAGANMHHLSPLAQHWTGVDLDDDLLQIGRDRLNGTAELVAADLHDLPFPDDTFGLAVSIQTLSWLDSYETPMRELLRVTRGPVVVSSLFADSDLDAYVKVRGDGYEANYNVYSLRRFEAFCRDHGASDVRAQPFEIGLDLPRPGHGGMQTWTERTEDGRRLQFSGPVHMPWYFVTVR